MSKKIFALIVSGLCASLFYWSELKLERLVEIHSIVIVFGSLFPIVFVLARSGAAHWSESMLALGVPLGLLGGTIGVTGMSDWMSDYRAAYPASAMDWLRPAVRATRAALRFTIAVHTSARMCTACMCY